MLIHIKKVHNKSEFISSQKQGVKPSGGCSNHSPEGDLVWPCVGNAQYDRIHKIYSRDGSHIGNFKNAFENIGYTYCIYFCNKSRTFIITHVFFRAKKSYISIISADGLGFFSRKLNFIISNRVELPLDWVGSELIVSSIQEKNKLIVVSSLGFCVFNTANRSLERNILFGNEYSHQVSDASLSPNERMLAIFKCEWKYTDPITGNEVYENSIIIYSVLDGDVLNTTPIESSESMNGININFSTCNSKIRLTEKHSGDIVGVYSLEASA